MDTWIHRGISAWRHGGMAAWRHGGMEAWRHVGIMVGGMAVRQLQNTECRLLGMAARAAWDYSVGNGMGVDIEGVDAAWAHGQHAECYM
jgi:hypothetical protein